MMKENIQQILSKKHLVSKQVAIQAFKHPIMKKIISYLIIAIFLNSCSNSKIITLATQGELSQTNFNIEIPLLYHENHIYIDIVINQKAYTFLFDTGWDITHIDKSLLEELNFTPFTKQKVSGSSFDKTTLVYGTLTSLFIGDIEFKNIGIGIQDMYFLKSTFPDERKIYGIIGTNILRKACWQINYKEQTLKFSDKIENFLPKPNAHEISMLPKSPGNWGLNRIKLTINGVTNNFVLDTGSYGSFSANPDFLDQLEKVEKPLEEIPYINQDSKQKFKIDELTLDAISFKNQELMIEKGIDLLIGNAFLENYIVTINWSKNSLFLNP
ncbi:MAG: aspartyl protease family protein [Chitinophagales bacterium]|nr:aspartyl protease family protein [Chitinophagales bacterium]